MMSDDEREYEELIAYTTYQWDCACGFVNTQEQDPAGTLVECENCDDTVWIRETV